MLDTYKKGLKDQSNLLDKLKEEYEEKYSKLEDCVERKIKERITGLQSKCNKLSVEMNKTIKSLTTDVSVST